MRRYLLRERLLTPPERWAATRQRTEQYRASERVAMNRVPQTAHGTRRIICPQVGHCSRVFRPAIGRIVTNLPLHLHRHLVTSVPIPLSDSVRA